MSSKPAPNIDKVIPALVDCRRFGASSVRISEAFYSLTRVWNAFNARSHGDRVDYPVEAACLHETYVPLTSANMNSYDDTLLECLYLQHEQPSFRMDNLSEARQGFPEDLYDTDAASDSEDELLRYAIMLSLQAVKADSSSGGAGDEALASDMHADRMSLDESRSMTDSDFLPSKDFITQSSMLLDLPLEIKETICGFVFDGEDITFSLRRDTQKFILDWGLHLSILLVCQEIGTIAMRCLRRRETTIDLRQYRRATIGTSSCSTPSLEDLLSQDPGLRSVCTKLILSQGQGIPSDELRVLIPTLAHVELYDYRSCRKIIRQTLSYSGRIFEYAVPRMVMNEAARQLSVLQEDLPSNVDADLIFVCDTLVCIPEYDFGSISSSGSPETKEGCTHTKGWKDLLKRGTGEPCKQCIKAREEKYEHSPQYRTAKLRHSILFNKSNPDGTWISKDWVVAGLAGSPSFSCGDTLAIHCHEYCLELIERGETLGI